MAMSGADLGCCGPFRRCVPGTDTAGGCFAECCGYLCPPDCCDEIVLTFECGKPSDPFCCVNPLHVQKFSRRIVDDVDYEFPIGPGFIPIPSFRKDRVRSSMNLFVLGEGNLPCAQTIVRLHVEEMCCLEVDGTNIYAIGTGIVHAEVSSPDNSIEITINGDTPPVQVQDGQRVIVEAKGHDCDACLVSITDLCSPYGEPLWLPVHDDDTGDLNFVLNQSEALRRVNMIKIKNIRNAMGKMFKERGVRKSVSPTDVKNIMKKIR